MKKGKFIKCLVCGKDTYKKLSEIKNGAKFCSHSCLAKNNKNWVLHGFKKGVASGPKQQPLGNIKKCVRCGKEFYDRNQPNKAFCSHYCQSTRIMAYHSIVLSVFDNKCSNCQSNVDLHIHHIIPMSLGGKDDIKNITVVCGVCHRKTHKKTT